MKPALLLLFCLLGLVASVARAAPSADALSLVEKLKIQEFDRFLGAPRGLPASQLELLHARFGIDALLQHVASHFDATYSPAQIKGMLALWHDPHMRLLVGELMGTQAPINQLLSKWTRDRQQLIVQMRKDAPPNKP